MPFAVDVFLVSKKSLYHVSCVRACVRKCVVFSFSVIYFSFAQFKIVDEVQTKVKLFVLLFILAHFLSFISKVANCLKY